MLFVPLQVSPQSNSLLHLCDVLREPEALGQIEAALLMAHAAIGVIPRTVVEEDVRDKETAHIVAHSTSHSNHSLKPWTIKDISIGSAGNSCAEIAPREHAIHLNHVVQNTERAESSIAGVDHLEELENEAFLFIGGVVDIGNPLHIQREVETQHEQQQTDHNGNS